MSNYTLKVQANAFSTEPSYDVNGYNGLYGYNTSYEGGPWGGYDQDADWQSGDTITITQASGGLVFTAEIASWQYGQMKWTNHAGAVFQVSVGDSVAIARADGTTILSSDWGSLFGSSSLPELSFGENYVPQAGDTFNLSRSSTSENFAAVVVSWTPNSEQYGASDLVVSGTGFISLVDESGYAQTHDLDQPISFSRSGSPMWSVEYASNLFHYSQSESVGSQEGGGNMSAKNFTHLIGKPQEGGQKMPELLDIANGDILTLGDLIISSSEIKAKADGTGVITGKISSIDNHSTSDLAEGTNLYHTIQRVRESLQTPDFAEGSSPSFSYDSSNGKYSLTVRSEAEIEGFFSVEVDPGLPAGSNSSKLAQLEYDSAGKFKLSSMDISGIKSHFSAPLEDGLSYSDGELSLAQDIRTSATPQFAGMTINGDLQVTGTQLIANVTTVEVEDNIFHLNKKADGAPAVTPARSGLRIETADEQNDRAFLWVQDATGGARFQAVDMPELDSADSPLGSLLPIEASMFHGPLTGDVTGKVSDISNHDTDALSEGSTNLYFTDARVHAAVSAQKGVVESAPGVFEAAIDASSELEIQKDNGLKINFSVDDQGSETVPHHGSLSYADNQLTFVPVTVAEIRGDISLPVPTAATGDALFGSASYSSSTGVITVEPAKRSEIWASISAQTLTANGAGSIQWDDSEGKIKLTPMSTDYIKSQFSADGDDALSYANGVFSLDIQASDAHMSSWAALTPAEKANSLVAKISETDGVISLESLKVSDIKGSLSVEQGAELDFDPNAGKQPLASLVYSAETGASTFRTMDSEDVQGMFMVAPATGAPANDAAAELVYAQDGEIKLKTMSKQDIRDLFSASGNDGLDPANNAISYDAATGNFTLNALDRIEVRSYLSSDATVGIADPSAQADLLGSVSYNATSGVISSQMASVAQVRDLISVADAGSALMSVSYDKLTGVISVDPMTKAEMWAEFSAAKDADVAGDQQFGDISITDGAVELVRVKSSEIRSVLSGENAAVYDAQAGKISLKLDSASGILSQAATGLRVDLSASNVAQATTEEPLAALTENDGAFELKSMTKANVKAMLSAVDKPEPTTTFGGIDYNAATGEVELTRVKQSEVRSSISVPASSNPALTYNAVSGELSLAASQDFSVVTADAFCDTGVGNAAVDIPAGCLVDSKGELAKALVDEWLCLGSNHSGAQIANGSSMSGKIEMLASGSVQSIACDGAAQAGDWLYLSPSAGGKVTTTVPTGDGEVAMIIGRAMGASSNGEVLVAVHAQFLYNC